MVVGLQKFKEYFTNFSDRYIIIGGVACELYASEQGLNFRATKDIDLMIIVESFDKEFKETLLSFVKDGKYEKSEVDGVKRQSYRFTKPQTAGFPVQLELFSRKPDGIIAINGLKFTQLKLDDYYTGIYTILTDDEYCKFTIENSKFLNGLHIPTTEALICMKAYAYLNLMQTRDAGKIVNTDDIKKHKNDVFRLTAMLEDNKIATPEKIKKDLISFIKDMQKQALNLKNVFKEMGIKNIPPNDLFGQLKKTFNLTDLEF